MRESNLTLEKSLRQTKEFVRRLSFDESIDQDKIVKPKINKKNYCLLVSKIIFSQFGFLVGLLLYSLFGAGLFIVLERFKELENCENGKGQEYDIRIQLISDLFNYIQFNITSNPSDQSRDNETIANSKIESMISKYRDQVILLNSPYYFYSGQDDCISVRWTFWNSVLFAITIVSTIG